MLRRRILPLIAGILLPVSGAVRAQDTVRVTLKPAGATVNPLLMSSYSELHGGDLVPGIYEQYVLNPSLEPWYRDGKDEKSELIFRDTPEYPGVAYPWEVLHLKGDARLELSGDCVNTAHSQRVTVATGAKVRLFQKIPLPLYRVDTYKLTFYAKSDSGKPRMKVRLMDGKDADVARSKACKISSLSTEWRKYEVVLKASGAGKQYLGRYDLYLLSFEVSGSGSVLLDQVNLFPSDCVEGIYNPETLNYFREFKVAGIRWPGGNYTSCYHWKNGVGDVLSRPVTPNKAWNGFDTNGLGTDEFLHWCSIAGITPIMGVGFGEVTCEEIASWVEYCNGDASTPMGALRAANGHPEPYNVKYWGIGNEVYGSYQVGHCSPEEYIAGMVEIAGAIRVVDPSVTIIASAYGVHNYFRKASDWNRKVIPALAPYVDMMDVHDYVYGPKWETSVDNSAEENFRTYAGANYMLREYIASFRELAGNSGLKMASLEWGILPPEHRNAPRRTTFANMLLSAMQMNEKIRNADIYELAAFHNFSFYVQSHSNHAEPVNVRTIIFPEYHKMGGGELMSAVTEGMPTYRIPLKYKEIKVKGRTPEVDIAAVRKDGRVFVSLVNRSLDRTMRLSIDAGSATAVSGNTYVSDRPFDRCTWTENPGLKPEVLPSSATVDDSGSALVSLPPMSFTMLKIDIQ
ncbi:MAG: hypothetical protein IJM35_10425 [Bacteroidales bacterium]|nr:hypothetical protein [Bacteroidales bacterium]